jgi:mRNA interferase MazF
MGVIAPPRRGDVFLADLSAARGREIRKARPCVVVSPDELNARMGTYLVAPLTTGAHPYAFRIPCRFAGKDGHVIADQVRAVDGARLRKRIGVITAVTLARTLATLREMFED